MSEYLNPSESGGLRVKRHGLAVVVFLAISSLLIGLLAGCGQPTSQPTGQGAQPAASGQSQPAASGQPQPTASGQAQPAASGQPETITFVNWVSAEEGTRDQMKTVLDAFQKANPNIKVDVKPIPVSDVPNQVTIMATGGNPPDISQVQGDTVVTLASSGFLEPVDDLMPKAFLDDMPKNIMDSAGLYQGKHYAVPWAPVENGFWYNKKLMQQAGLDPNKPPTTMDELNQAVAQARPKLPKETVMLQLDTTNRTIGLYDQWPFMLAFNDGVPVVDAQGKISVNTAGMKAYGEWIRAQVKDGNTLPGKKFGEFRPMAAQNQLLFGFDLTALVGMMQSMNKALTAQEIYDTWGLTAYPAGKNGMHYTADVNHDLVIFKGSTHKQAAMKLAEFLVNSDEALKGYILPVGYSPMTKSAPQRIPEISKNPIVKSFAEKVLPTVVAMPYGPNYSQMSDVIMSSVQEMITTDKPVADILANAETKLKGIYK
jgi:ABC-type glycerol-3-phosphate transport system substrate-binding protein